MIYIKSFNSEMCFLANLKININFHAVHYNVVMLKFTYIAKYMTKSQVRHSTVIITAVNTQGNVLHNVLCFD